MRPQPAARDDFAFYAATAVDRIHFIKRAQALGFSLNEIHEARPLQWQRWAASVLPCSGAAPRDRLGELETKLPELAALQETLKATLKQCERAISTKNESACPVVEFATEKDGVT